MNAEPPIIQPWEPWSELGCSPGEWWDRGLWRGFVFSPEYARRNARQVHEAPTNVGIYLLIAGDAVVYVGESKNIRRRLEQHAKTRAFNGVFWFKVPDFFRVDIERAYIHALSPPWNEKFDPTADDELVDAIYHLWAEEPC